jgi:hypothetical protein
MRIEILPTFALAPAVTFDVAFVQRKNWMQYNLIQTTNLVIGRQYEAEKYRRLADEEIRSIEKSRAREGALAAASTFDLRLMHERLDLYERKCIENQVGVRTYLEELQKQVVELQNLSAQLKDWVKDKSPEVCEKAANLAADIELETMLVSAWVQEKLTEMDKASASAAVTTEAL